MPAVFRTLIVLLALMLSSVPGQARVQDPGPLSPQAETIVEDEARQATLPPQEVVVERAVVVERLDLMAPVAEAIVEEQAR